MYRVFKALQASGLLFPRLKVGFGGFVRFEGWCKFSAQATGLSYSLCFGSFVNTLSSLGLRVSKAKP